ncbi:CUB and sushi domain-containing protein 2-like [Daphnia pulicaria]|uniref:CUB and sushi domain-containing protein 2-like n=1 Tax=Daphnia pulicaria TaxID=35523 RepID=UPI001EE9F0B4|nr:CUB and sushi domain-containing protein 2-like [Daphnia pulicaria]XP_046654626.1 CUB and sushi domain-containing protein 2-like [Daphnia pulicaria]
MKFFPIVFILAVVCLAVAAGEARDGICNSQKTPTKLIARRTWPGQFATTTTTAKPTTVKPSTTAPTTATTTTTMATTTPLPILFNCSVSNPACGTMCTNLTSAGGVVQSPNFPGDYGNNDMDCEVTITTPAEWMIQLKFTTFNLETGKAYVYVSDGVTMLSNPTGNTIPALVPATTKKMVILFTFNRSNKPSSATYNWRATFSVTSQGSSCSVINPACGNMCTNVTSEGTGVVQSSNFPGDYGNIVRSCQVSIVVPAGKRIQLTFTTFNLEAGYSSINVLESGKIYMFGVTGSAIPAVVTTSANIVYLQFDNRASTKPNTATYNWQATYTAVTV